MIQPIITWLVCHSVSWLLIEIDQTSRSIIVTDVTHVKVAIFKSCDTSACPAHLHLFYQYYRVFKGLRYFLHICLIDTNCSRRGLAHDADGDFLVNGMYL